MVPMDLKNTPVTGQSVEGPAPIALVYLPQILGDEVGGELERVGRKLALAIDRQGGRAGRTYRSEMDVVEMDGRMEPRCRVLCREAGEIADRAVVDVFLVDYRPRLMARYREGSLIRRCFLAGVGLAEMLVRSVMQVFRNRHVRLDRMKLLQMVPVVAGLLLVGAYFGTLGMGVVRVAEQAWTLPEGRSKEGVSVSGRVSDGSMPEPSSRRGGTIESASEAWGPWVTRKAGELPGQLAARVGAGVRWVYQRSGYVVALMVAMGFVGTGRSRMTELVKRLSEELLAFVYYLSFADRRSEVTGQVDGFVERLVEATGGRQRIGLMGYSFGSIVAMDALFPADAIRASRMDSVELLVTIGTPVDFIARNWPGYFDGRHQEHRAPATWVNVYSPMDILATRFHGEQAGHRGGFEPAPDREHSFRENLVNSELTFLGVLTLAGLRAHSQYWSAHEDGERNCFQLIVGDVFPEEVKPVCAGPSV